MALLDRWRSLRQQRQQEAGDRQQEAGDRRLQVHATLTEFRTQLTEVHAQRLTTKHQLQTDLQDYRSSLALNEEMRQAEAQQDRANLQQSVRSLQQQTQDFLSASAADRGIMADSLNDSLRQYIAQLQTETQQLLSSNSQQRREMHDRLRQELSTFVEALQTSVKTLQSKVQRDIQELELLRYSGEQRRNQDRVRQVQEMLSQSRANRLAQAKNLSERLNQLRAELRQYRRDLTMLVWGDRLSVIVPSKLPKLMVASSLPTIAPEIIELQPVAEELTLDAEDESAASVNAEDVYSYIQLHPGIRLAEIEEALGISRVQAVDALRFLIQTGAIAQRDRLYFAQ